MVNEIDRKVADKTDKMDRARLDGDVEAMVSIDMLTYKLEALPRESLMAAAALLRNDVMFLSPPSHGVREMARVVRSALADALDLMAEHKRLQVAAKAAEEATA